MASHLAHQRSRPSLNCLCFFAFTAIACLVIRLFAGQFAFEKTLKSLLCPIGLIWLGIAFQICCFATEGQRKPLIVSLALWLILTVAGNQISVALLGNLLEKPYLQSSLTNSGPFDAILILGGSTGTSPTGEPQGGERVFAGARLYLQGKTKALVVSGEQAILASTSDLHPNQEAEIMLIDTGIPKSAIELIGGRNTYEEISQLKTWLSKQTLPANYRIGILSDASHLQRAMRLCENNRINAEPVPSQFISTPFNPTPNLIIPSAENISATQAMIYELIGRWIGR